MSNLRDDEIKFYTDLIEPIVKRRMIDYAFGRIASVEETINHINKDMSGIGTILSFEFEAEVYDREVCAVMETVMEDNYDYTLYTASFKLDGYDQPLVFKSVL